MPLTIVMGGQWGDEGKGKLTDRLAAEAAVSFAQTAAPTPATRCRPIRVSSSSILSLPDPQSACLSFLGAGVVVDPEVLVEEIDDLTRARDSAQRFRISDRAHA